MNIPILIIACMDGKLCPLIPGMPSLFILHAALRNFKAKNLRGNFKFPWPMQWELLEWLSVCLGHMCVN